MAIHGTAFGGGLEVAMAGHYRVISPRAQVGQPEVKLGIIPGAAGTQRLPRLAGVAKAVEMCAFGEPIGAEEALAARIVDRIIEGDLLDGRDRVRAGGRAASRSGSRGTGSERLTDVDPAICNLRGGAARRPRKRSAARRLRSRRSKRWRRRRAAVRARLPARGELFDECLRSTQCEGADPRVLRRARGREDSRIVPKDTPTCAIRRAAVIGAGTMGGGITMNYANAGIPVIAEGDHPGGARPRHGDHPQELREHA